MKIPADDDCSNAQSLDQHSADEVFGRERSQSSVESQNDCAVEPELFQRPRLDGRRGQTKDDRPAGEKIGWMRLERQYGAGRAKFGGQLLGSLYHRPMA